MINITCDRSTQASEVVSNLKAMTDVKITFTDLECPSCILADGTAVLWCDSKRFTHPSAREKDITFLAEYLAANFRNVTLLLIGGDIFNKCADKEKMPVIGSMSYLRNILGTAILPMQDSNMAATYIYWTAKHFQEGIIKPRVPLPELKGNYTHRNLYLVQGLFGIHAKDAQKLLIHFGTPRKIFLATEQELANIRGITKEKAKRISDHLDSNFDSNKKLKNYGDKSLITKKKIENSKCPANPGDAALFLIQSLPISRNMAQKILNHFQTPRQFFAAKRKDLICIEGLGSRNIRKILTILDHRNEEDK